MTPTAKAVKDYIAGLPDGRREAIQKVRQVVLAHLPKGYEEVFSYGLICYQVPLSVCSETYNGQPLMYAALANQKNHMGLYLMCAYQSPAMTHRLQDGFKQAGKRLDMGKSCVRFKRLEDLPLAVVGEAIASTSVKEFLRTSTEVDEKPARTAKRAKPAMAAKPAKSLKQRAR